jgi:hypothetical protein
MRSTLALVPVACIADAPAGEKAFDVCANGVSVMMLAEYEPAPLRAPLPLGMTPMRLSRHHWHASLSGTGQLAQPEASTPHAPLKDASQFA